MTVATWLPRCSRHGHRLALSAGSSEAVACSIDCGLFQGAKALRQRNWASPEINAATIDAVVLTHAHIDHSGYLPRLMTEGFRGPIFCTPATRNCAACCCPTAAACRKRTPASPTSTATPRIGRRCRCTPRRTPTPCCDSSAQSKRTSNSNPPGVSVREFRYAGHILGAAFARLACEGTSITFSGDIGRSDDVLMEPPEAPRKPITW